MILQNAAAARAGKSIVRPSTAEKNARKPPISAGLVFLLLFVVVGGGSSAAILKCSSLLTRFFSCLRANPVLHSRSTNDAQVRWPRVG